MSPLSNKYELFFFVILSIVRTIIVGNKNTYGSVYLKYVFAGPTKQIANDNISGIITIKYLYAIIVNSITDLCQFWQKSVAKKGVFRDSAK